MKKFIITCNAGSSNIKLAKFNSKSLELIDKLHFEKVDEVISWYKNQNNIISIGHRVVHGGHRFTQPIILDEVALKKLKELESLAPLHQPLALSIISQAKKIKPQVTQIACFDTAFHKDIPNLERLFPIPISYFKEGIYRYGFHGLSYEHIASVFPNIAKKAALKKTIVAHLGNGASICGMINLQSKAISMGFAALDGLMMGTRSGTIDTSVILYLLKQKGLNIEQLEELLYKNSGLKGVSNISNDVKTLENSNNKGAKLALKLFCYTAAKHIGAIAMAIGGIDNLIFTGGIGENSSHIRSKICSYLNWLNMTIDNKANNSNLEKISNNQSNIPVYVIPTDEEKVIANHCAGLA